MSEYKEYTVAGDKKKKEPMDWKLFVKNTVANGTEFKNEEVHQTLVLNAIKRALDNNAERWEDILCVKKADPDDWDYDDAWFAFTIWTKNFIYIPCVYDGSFWYQSVGLNHETALPIRPCGGGGA
jgi:hypothetical protein